MRRIADGISPLRAGVLGLLVIAATTYAVFTKAIPFREHYEITAVVENSNLISPRSPVRVAGVDIGKITAVGRYRRTNLGQITMRIEREGRPVHADATLKIRPRLFLEGNFYVDLNPGTPKAPELEDGGLIPVGQTARPVQLDQVLDSLDTATRRSLQQTLQGLGAALDEKPTRADDRRQDPRVRGLTGGEALNETLETSPRALRDSAKVEQALVGPPEHDLEDTIRGFARASSGLARRETELADLVSEFNATVRAMAAEGPALRRTVHELAPTARHAREGFAALNEALPVTGRFARSLTPGMAEIPATTAAARPWLAQARPLLSNAELGGLLRRLSPATADLARLGASTRKFLPEIDSFNRCVTDVLLPTGDIVVDDGPLSSSQPNYQEFWQSLVGQAAEGQGFDGNGPFLRLGATGGPNLLQTGRTNFTGDPRYVQSDLPPLRTRPAYPNKVPPLRRDVPCATSPVPDVNGPASTGPADGSRPGAPPPPLPDDPTGEITQPTEGATSGGGR